MEFADKGDLFQKICEHQKNHTNFSESEIWTILIQVIVGLRALHELNILHRDLKVNALHNPSRVPTSSCSKTPPPSSATSTSARSPTKDLDTPKQALLTTPVLKSGGTNPTTPSPTFGPWAVSCMR